MRILVTGAAGFIGSHLCERLLSMGCDVVGVDNFDPYYDRAVKESNLTGPRASDRFTFVCEDLRNLDAVRALWDDHCGGVETIDPTGGRPSPQRRQR